MKLGNQDLTVFRKTLSWTVTSEQPAPKSSLLFNRNTHPQVMDGRHASSRCNQDSKAKKTDATLRKYFATIPRPPKKLVDKQQQRQITCTHQLVGCQDNCAARSGAHSQETMLLFRQSVGGVNAAPTLLSTPVDFFFTL